MVIVLLRNLCSCQTLPPKTPTQNDHGCPSFVDVKMQHLHFHSNLLEATDWLMERNWVYTPVRDLYPTYLGTLLPSYHPLFLLSAVKKSFFAWLLQPCCHFCFSDVLSGAVGNPIQKRAPLHSHAGRVAENCRPPCKPPCHETPCLCWSYPSSSMSVVIARCHRAMGAPFNAGGLMEGILATLQATQHLHRFSKKFKGSWWGKQPLDMDIFFGWVGLRFNESVQSVNSTQQTLHSKFWIHLSSVGDKIDH